MTWLKSRQHYVADGVSTASDAHNVGSPPSFLRYSEATHKRRTRIVTDTETPRTADARRRLPASSAAFPTLTPDR